MMNESSNSVEPPTKRVKLSSPTASNVVMDPLLPGKSFGASTKDTEVVRNEPESSDERNKEIGVGITAHVQSASTHFTGLLKKRYTDFLVNEILPNGEVLHLRNLKANRSNQGPSQRTEVQSHPPTNHVRDPALRVENTEAQDQARRAEPKPVADTAQDNIAPHQNGNDTISSQDKDLLMTYFEDGVVDEITDLYKRIVSSPEAKGRDIGIVRTSFTADRSIRGKIHQDIRRIFRGKVDSSTDHDGMLVLSATLPDHRRPANQPGRNQWGRDKRPNWADRGGDYLHFSLYKENKDTMEVVFFLKNQLKTNVKTFQFAGTKDKRAVTVQRVSGHRIEAERLAGLNRMLRGSSLGDFEYHKHGLELGDLKGNEFVITLRDCHFDDETNISPAERLQLAQATVETGLVSLRERGFFNYYGLQRFGTFATRTDTIGTKLLQGDFKGACDDILSFSPHVLAAAQNPESTEMIGWEDKARAEAIEIFKTTGRVNEALDKLPRKFSAESNLIRQLGKNPHDYAGALMMIQRNLRLMYVHAYQSLVWNLAVGERWRLYGDQVVEGDLVLVNEHKDKVENGAVPEEVDADGEIVIQPSFEDRAHAADDVFERARVLTAEEAAGGQYTVFDIVLPQPGFDVLYPQNAMDEWYKTFMGSVSGGGLDPYDMRRKQKDYSLSGGYRKILARIEPDYSAEVRAYVDEDAQFVQTDLARLKENDDRNGHNKCDAEIKEPQEGDKIAIILQFQLRSSQYATMALRELSRGGVMAHKPDFSAGR